MTWHNIIGGLGPFLEILEEGYSHRPLVLLTLNDNTALINLPHIISKLNNSLIFIVDKWIITLAITQCCSQLISKELYIRYGKSYNYISHIRYVECTCMYKLYFLILKIVCYRYKFMWSPFSWAACIISCHSKEVLVKGGITTLHSSSNYCSNINVYLQFGLKSCFCSSH